MWTCIHRFFKESELVKAGQAGKDFAAASEEEGFGFEPTELELRLSRQGEQIRKRLSERPEELTPEAVRKIVRALINCRAGITSRRCRLLACAGDYGDVLTLTAMASGGVMRDLRMALAKLGPEGERMVTSMPEALRKTELRVYDCLDGGDETAFDETVEKHLRG